MLYKLLLSMAIVILILFAFVQLIKSRRCLHIYITSCKSTWDTVPYFGLNGMPMILFLWSPPPPLIKVASNTIQSSKLGRTTLNEGEEGGGYFKEWPATMQIYCYKRKCLHKKEAQLLQDWFGTPTLLPFHCFGTPMRRCDVMWKHSILQTCDLPRFAEKGRFSVAVSQHFWNWLVTNTYTLVGD